MVADTNVAATETVSTSRLKVAVKLVVRTLLLTASSAILFNAFRANLEIPPKYPRLVIYGLQLNSAA